MFSLGGVSFLLERPLYETYEKVVVVAVRQHLQVTVNIAPDSGALVVGLSERNACLYMR